MSHYQELIELGVQYIQYVRRPTQQSPFFFLSFFRIQVHTLYNFLEQNTVHTAAIEQTDGRPCSSRNSTTEENPHDMQRQAATTMSSKNLSMTATSPPSKKFDPDSDASRTDVSEESQEMTLFVQDLVEQMVSENVTPSPLQYICIHYYGVPGRLSSCFPFP
jgi:hypothetical protein